MQDTVTWFRERGLICSAQPTIKEYLEFETPIRVWPGAILRETSIGAYTYVAHLCNLLHASIGRYCSIGNNCRIGLTEHPLERLTSSPISYLDTFGDDVQFDPTVDEFNPITIGHDVWIGVNAMLKGGLTVGTGAVIGAGAMVTRDVPPYAVVAGNPARIRKMRFSDALIEKLLASEWWSYDLRAVARAGRLDWSNVEATLDAIAAMAATGEIQKITARAARIDVDAAGTFFYRRPA